VILARQADLHDGPGVRLLLRDLVTILGQLGEHPPEEPPDHVDEIRAALHRKKVERLLRGLDGLIAAK
jgi:hypothetical protein